MNLFNVYPRFNITLSKAEGVYVYDENDESYLDLYGGHGVNSVGHSHSIYTQRLKEQIDRIAFYSNSIEMPLQEELARKLSSQSGYPNYNLFLCNSGAEANENAIKLASFSTDRKKVVAFKGSFHGRTSAALNVTDNVSLSASVNQNNFPVDFIELNNKGQLVDALKKKDVCAVIVEGIQGVGGLDSLSEDYFSFLEQNCKEHGALLILDEIQSGFGRSGKFFAHQYANIEADIITMAKGMGNGFPIGGLLINPKIKAKNGMLGTTFGGNHLACTASIAVLEIIQKESLLNNVKQINKHLLKELKQFNDIKEIKGKGLMLGIEFDFPVKEMRINLLSKYHIFTGASANPNLLRILPPLGITVKEIAPFISALKEILS
ncbi:MAG: aminotransferase class III-fold pyridoxal phosphate-dependent enzyme [Crocinitomicaceae bacterium]|nr:aminotransferase class III-fold pyridoxal phosphate-dependent enzyme [Crocinitomicaceae bacterium]